MLERQSFLKYEPAYFSQILIYLTFSIQFQFYYVSTTLAEVVGRGGYKTTMFILGREGVGFKIEIYYLVLCSREGG